MAPREGARKAAHGTCAADARAVHTRSTHIGRARMTVPCAEAMTISGPKRIGRRRHADADRGAAPRDHPGLGRGRDRRVPPPDARPAPGEEDGELRRAGGLPPLLRRWRGHARQRDVLLPLPRRPARPEGHGRGRHRGLFGARGVARLVGRAAGGRAGGDGVRGSAAGLRRAGRRGVRAGGARGGRPVALDGGGARRLRYPRLRRGPHARGERLPRRASCCASWGTRRRGPRAG